MNLTLDNSIIGDYSSGSQQARVLTENWVSRNIYCPVCGNEKLTSFKNNNPVGDFSCGNCRAEYELKSKKDSFSQKIVDGAYATMIQRINSDNNPHFFFLNYSITDLSVQNFLVIPKHYFVDQIVEKRNPLAETARRAGWVGCNILLHQIPSTGKIFFVKNGKVESKLTVLENWSKTAFLANQKKEARGWIIEILKIVDQIGQKEFKLSDVYAFEEKLKMKFPNNNFIRDKIRQQLQILRDRGIIVFQGNGVYRKI